MRKCITLLVCIFCASVCWGQYSTSYVTGVTDITSYLPTTNAWKALPNGGICARGLWIGGQGDLECLAVDGKIYERFPGDQTWVYKSAMGTTKLKLAPIDPTHIYAIGAGGLDSCGNGVSMWNGTAWVPKHGCLDTLSAGSDNILFGTNAGATYKSVDSGMTWTQISGANLNNVSASGESSVCGTTATQVLLLQGNGTFAAMPSQPASSGISGCVITTDSNSLFAWGSFGVKRFDFHANTWNVVTGLSGVVTLTSGLKGTTFALSSTGAPYHLNVYAGFLQGTTSGIYNKCPSQTCGNSILHHGDLRVYLPHGLAGVDGHQDVVSTDNMNVSSLDFSPTCDPFFGDPADPECQGLATGSVICGATGTNFQAPPNNPPPPPPIPSPHWSEYMGYWDGNSPNWNNPRYFALGGLGGWIATIECGDTDSSACGVGTYAVCSPIAEPAIGEVSSEGISYGNGATQAFAKRMAQLNCAGHTHGGGRAWGTFSNYTVDLVKGVVSCIPIVVYDDKPGTPCY